MIVYDRFEDATVDKNPNANTLQLAKKQTPTVDSILPSYLSICVAGLNNTTTTN
jgi:hypothetical protein